MQDWELVAQVCRAYRALSDTLLDQFALGRTQVRALHHLYVQEGLTQSEIGERLAVKGATVTNLLQRMEEKGLIARSRDPDDKRLVRVYLTPKGQEKEESIIDQFQNLENKILEGITEKERVVLRRIVKQMLGNMGLF